ncbi:uncharacterized protein [Macrobrachium rosenbergii]|uniref:uncharacterized protein n=1 Tax=Macrobrachium rosenbergii TaxID=79674 RepID=UPI0034D6FACD
MTGQCIRLGYVGQWVLVSVYTCAHGYSLLLTEKRVRNTFHHRYILSQPSANPRRHVLIWPGDQRTPPHPCGDCEIINEGEHISWCQEAEKHLQTIAENRVLLIYHLQQPFMNSYLSMHYEYHRDLLTLVEDLIEILSKTEAYLQLIENQVQDSVLQQADVIMSIAQTMSELKKILDNVFALKTIISKMIGDQHAEDVSTE